jgi:hypothetical protein
MFAIEWFIWKSLGISIEFTNSQESIYISILYNNVLACITDLFCPLSKAFTSVKYDIIFLKEEVF